MLRFALPDSPLPPVVGESCLHHQFRRSTCRACADACPAQALVIHSQGVSVVEDQCLHCGNCLFVCPTSALENIAFPLRSFQHHRLTAPFTLFPPGLNELLLWHVQYQIRGVDISLDADPHWGLAIANLNLKLRQLGEPCWQIFPPQETALSARRRLLALLRQSPNRASVDINLLSTAFPGFSLHTPELDTKRCLLCGACSRVCGSQALLIKEGEFTLNAEACNGCNACQAVCPVEAIAMTTEIRLAEKIVHALYQAQCAGCGRLFWSWNARSSQCSVCLQHVHGMR